MEAFWQDLRYAVRTLRNSPGFTIIAVVTLGLGMAVNTTIFSVINGLLLRPLPVPTPSRSSCSACSRRDARVQTFLVSRLRRRAQSDRLLQRCARLPVPRCRHLAVDGKGDHCVLSRVSELLLRDIGISRP